MFKERLEEIRGRINDALAVSIIGRDGIPVDTVSGESVLDIDLLAAELITRVQGIDRDHSELDLGNVRQMSISTDRYTLMMGEIAEDYYLLVVYGDRGSHGRARYEIRRARLIFESDL